MLGYSRVDATGRANAELRPEFFMDSVLDEAATAASGRPIYRDVESVKIIVPGLTATVVVHRVNQSHVQRWPDYYEAFRRGLEAPVHGTPIEAWCLMTPAQVKTLKAREIKTVEELARISDTAAGQLGMGGLTLRQHARAYLDDAEHEALRTHLQAENDGLKSAVTALQYQVDQLNTDLARIADENRRWAEDAHLRRAYAEGPAGYPLPAPGPQGPHGYATPPNDPHGGGGYAPSGQWGPATAPDPFANLAHVPMPHRAEAAPEPEVAPAPHQAAMPAPQAAPQAAQRRDGPQAMPAPQAMPRNPPPPWGYNEPPPPEQAHSAEVRGDIAAELARAGLVGTPPAPEIRPEYPGL